MIITTILIILALILLSIIWYWMLYWYFLYTTQPCLIKNKVKWLKYWVILKFENWKHKWMKHFVWINSNWDTVDLTSVSIDWKINTKEKRQVVSSSKNNFTYIIDVLMIEDYNMLWKVRNNIMFDLNKNDEKYMFFQKYFYLKIRNIVLFLIKHNKK